jgi:hypothetical protein
MEIRIGRYTAEVPNEDGYYETELGPIEVEILEQSYPNGIIRQIALEGEVLLGTPWKNRHKRTSRKVISLSEYGRGAQDLSKRETVIVDLYPEHRGQVLRDMQILFRDDGY